MHATLTPPANFRLIALWGTAFLACALAAGSAATLPIGAFGAFGLLAGALQTVALRTDRSRFLRAVTALDVRRALSSSFAGKTSIAMVWLKAAALLVLFASGSNYSTVPTVLGCYSAFGLARECAALPGVFALARASQVDA